MLSRDQREWLRVEIDRQRRRQLRIVSAEHDLRQLLAAGPRDATLVVRSMKEADHTLSAIRKAARKLAVDQRSPIWSLPAARDHACAECGAPLATSRRRAEYCSTRCRVAAHRRRPSVEPQA